MGCNLYYRTSHTKPFNHNHVNCTSQNTIRTPLYSSFPQQLNVQYSCTTNHNLIILTWDNQIISYGSNYDHLHGDSPELTSFSHVPYVVYNGKSEKYSNPIVKLKCGTRKVFFKKRNNILFAFGTNAHGSLCVGFDSIGSFVPLLVNTSVNRFWSHSYITAVHFLNGKSNDIFMCGWGIQYLLGTEYGFEQYELRRISHEASVELAQEESEIKQLLIFESGVFLLFENNRVYYWGWGLFVADGIPPSILSFVKLPVKTPLYNIPSDNTEIIKFSALYYSVFALIADNNAAVGSERRNKVFSWGNYNNHGRLSVNLVGRTITSGDWYIALEVNYGEIPIEEEIIDIVTSFSLTRVITNKGNIFGFGVNDAGFLPGEIGAYYGSFTRCLSSYSNNADFLEIRLHDQEKLHFVIEVDVIIHDEIYWIIFSSSVVCFMFVVCIVFVMFLVVYLIIRMLKSKSIDIEQSKNDKESVEMFESHKEIEEFLSMALKHDENFVNFFSKWKNENENFVEKIKVINFTDLKLEKYIGAGGSGCSVFVASMNIEEKERKVAYKSFPIIFSKLEELFTSNDNKFCEFKRELTMFLRTSHPFVLNLYGVVIQKSSFGLVMEYCKCGDFKNFLMENKESITIEERMKILYKIAVGMVHLHFNNIIHRDLKLQNILISEHLDPKIMDFGISKLVVNSMTKTKNIGTVQYQSPELVLTGKYDEKVDVFSYSIIAFEVLTLNFDPFNEKSVDGNLAIEISTKPDFRPNISTLPTSVGEWFKKIIVKAWDHESFVRPSFSEICSEFRKNVVFQNFEMFEEKLKRDPITIFILKHGETSTNNAQDVDLNVFTITELTRIVHNHVNYIEINSKMSIKFYLLNNNNMKIEVAKELTTDKDILSLQSDDIIAYKIEKLQ